MRRALAASLLLSALTVLLPRALPATSEQEPASVQEPAASVTAAEEPKPQEKPLYTKAADKNAQVCALIDGSAQDISMQEWLIGVVAAEMPASFEPEALAAQAVAARTYTLYRQQVSPSANHAEEVCGNAECCKAYASPESLMELWGDDYDANLEKITAAVVSTDGQILVWEDEPILAVFHSSSGSSTESSENVWGTALPYLVSVTSPEDASIVPNHSTEVVFSAEEFLSIFLAAHPEASAEGEPADWFSSMSYTEGGRLGSISICGVRLKGTELRELFGLRSADISLRVTGNEISFRVVGYGHGAGMSQYGANAMALSGADAEEILAHYYPGASLKNIFY